MNLADGRFILIVEDCDEAVAALQIALESFYRCPVLHAPDGARALAMLEAESNAPLAVITDLNLPGLDGYQLLERLRGDRRFRQTPVVVISADTDPRTPERVRTLGADAFFSKPYSPAGVCKNLEKILHAKRELVASDTRPSGPDGADRA
jgi:CheY-like chemotaxis protein